MNNCVFVKIAGWVIFLLFVICIGQATAETSVPAIPSVRAFHVVAKNVLPSDMKRIIDQMQANQFNTLVLGLYDAVRLKSMPLEKEKVLTWSRDELSDVVAYARSKGMDVVPEIKLLSHQEQFLAKYKPNLLFNAVTYDPRKLQVYEFVFKVVDEIIDIVRPTAIHIGHDEVAGFSAYTTREWLGKGEGMLPAALFLDDVNRLHAYLKKKGVETWMWGDMLIAPDEFPDIRLKSLHGNMLGYGRDLRNKLPKDIVICDWHYLDDQADFPSLAAFRAEGFRVLGSTWKNNKTTRNFSRYAATHGADGMIATTWFHVQRKEWDVVESIIRDSGEAFRKDFPDAK